MKQFIWTVIVCLIGMDLFAINPCRIGKKPFNAGERIEYQLYYNLGFIWINAGDARFQVQESYWRGLPVYKLSATGKTHKSFDSFFHVRDTLTSVVDRQHLLPYQAIKSAHENKWHGKDVFEFESIPSGWKVTTRLFRREAWSPDSISYTERCGFDILTSIYRLRSIPDKELFVEGKRMELPLRLDDDEYTIYLTYKGRERIKLHGGDTHKAHAFELTLIEGTVFKRGDVMKMWISDDAYKVPLLIESPIRVGKVKAIFRSRTT